MIDRIDVITIDAPHGSGFIAYTRKNETVYIIAKAVGDAGVTVGDKMLAVLVPHRYKAGEWYAEWAYAYGDVTEKSVQDAWDSLKEGGAWTAEEIGLKEGDILYQAGIATKYITLHKKKRVDSMNDISYSVYPETVAVCEFEEEEE